LSSYETQTIILHCVYIILIQLSVHTAPFIEITVDTIVCNFYLLFDIDIITFITKLAFCKPGEQSL